MQKQWRGTVTRHFVSLFRVIGYNNSFCHKAGILFHIHVVAGVGPTGRCSSVVCRGRCPVPPTDKLSPCTQPVCMTPGSSPAGPSAEQPPCCSNCGRIRVFCKWLMI